MVEGEPLSRDIRTWRKRHAALLGAAERVLAPSRDCLEHHRRYYPEANYVYLPLPEDESGPGLEVERAPAAGGGTVRVLAMGELSLFEEIRLLEACAADAAERGLGITFRALGRSLQSARREPELPLSFSGPYDQEKLGELIESQRPDVILFPHRLPLAHSWSLGASMAAALPIVAPDFGVFPERLQSHPAAFLMSWDEEAAAWNDLILKIASKDYLDVNKA